MPAINLEAQRFVIVMTDSRVAPLNPVLVAETHYGDRHQEYL
jgi:hypothetical protein